MRILIIGASGTIGKRIRDEFSKKHEVISGSRSGADISVDISDAGSIEAMYKAVGGLDAVICAAGPAKFGPFSVMTEEDIYVGIHGKMMGQVNLVRIGQNYVNDNGSFTLTTGILADEPVVGSVGLSLVNGAVNSFAIAAAQELPRGQRINVVCPTVVEDSAEMYADFFPGFDPVAMDRVVNGYIRTVMGKVTGRIIRVY
jgi:NAD(P)-dependent dehydrogenase (short-subunit alcohol dehydrogenase family)